MAEDETRYTIQLVGERVTELAADVAEIKGDVKGVSGRVYTLELDAARRQGMATAASDRRSGWQHRLTVLAGICGAFALGLTVLTTVVHL